MDAKVDSSRMTPEDKAEVGGGSEQEGHVLELAASFTPDEERRVLRKIDRTILPLMCLVFFMQVSKLNPIISLYSEKDANKLTLDSISTNNPSAMHPYVSPFLGTLSTHTPLLHLSIQLTTPHPHTGLRPPHRPQPHQQPILLVLLHLLRRAARLRVPRHLPDVEALAHEVRGRHRCRLGRGVHVFMCAEELCGVRCGAVFAGFHGGRGESGFCDDYGDLVSEE